MKYAKKDAKAYARAHMKGIWAAALTLILLILLLNLLGRLASRFSKV